MSATKTITDYQMAVAGWAKKVFGEEIASDIPTRCYRFLEEAIELVQSLGTTKEQANILVNYVYGRPLGEPHQEVGGTMVTLAALCAAKGLSMNTCAWAEQYRCELPEVMEKIRLKQKLKPHPRDVLPASGDIVVLPQGVGISDVVQEPAYHANRNADVAVADYVYYFAMATCPRGVKVLLLGPHGVATLGLYDGDPQWRGWFPMPKERK